MVLERNSSFMTRKNAFTELPCDWRMDTADILAIARRLVEPVSSRGAALDVVLDSPHLRAFTVDVPKSVKRLSDIITLARARFSRLYNEHDSAWLVVPNFSPNSRLPVFAIKRELMDALLHLSKEGGCKLASVSPALTWAARWIAPLASKESQWLVSYSASSATAVLLDRHHPVVHQEFLPDHVDPRSFLTESVLARLNMASHATVGSTPYLVDEARAISLAALKVKDGGKLAGKRLALRRDPSRATLGRLSRFDFLQTEHPRAKLPAIGVALALLCALPLVWGAKEFAVTQATIAQVDAQHTRIAQQAHLTSRRPPTAQAPTSRQIDAINRAVASLNLPWDELLHGVALASKGDVAILSLRPNAASNEITGVAEAANVGNMLDFVNRLRLQAPFANAYLTAHEVVDRDPAKPMRFEFRAKWTS
ncbi:hypothetical protein [Burkholderia sp. PAMC 26561]|uniref:hypothetical protein n=1 Tax=Burkholderia sp. PAMC 26561 TaxID=1795043 RepID=UPI00076B0EE1|nr:hypothetical protein [Burkholderia sp. PAMC 26561]AME28680.1 hypothetical protein AXG89_33370 [Burkholderia sp. PAMC 26561]